MAADPNLLKFCYELYKNGQLVDLAIVCEGNTQVMVHGIVMAASSDFIKSFLLQVGDLSGICSSFKCESVSVEVVRALVEFVYRGKFGGLHGVSLKELLAVAKQLQVSRAVKEIEMMMESLCNLEADDEKWFACSQCYACFENKNEVTNGHCIKCHMKTVKSENADREMTSEADASLAESTSASLNLETSECEPMEDETNSPTKGKRSPVKNLSSIHKTQTFSVGKYYVCKTCKREFQSARLLKRHTCKSKPITVIVPDPSMKLLTSSEEDTGVEVQYTEATGDDEEYDESVDNTYLTEDGDEDEELVFKCPSCDFTTSKSRYLDDHTRIKHADVPVSCNYCQKTFSRKDVYRHQRKCPQKCSKPPAKRRKPETDSSLEGEATDETSAAVKLEAGDGKESNETSEEDHMTEEQSEETVFSQCPHCSFTCSKPRYLMDHTRNVHGSMPVNCPYCKKTFPRKEVFKHRRNCPERPKHVKKSKEVLKPDLPVLECHRPRCNFVTNLPVRLQSHLKWTHGEGRPKRPPGAPSKKPDGSVEIMCDKCGKILPNKSELKKHILSTHDIREFKCHLCEYTGKTAASQKSHYQHIHGINPDGTEFERKYACDKCDFKGVHKSTLEQHMRIHDNSKPFQCDQCLYQTNRKDSLTKHLQTMHVSDRKARMCRICGKTFLSATGFRVHCLSHMNAKPYKCEECNMEFLRMASYKNHMLTRHQNLKPLHCDQCQYSCVKGASMRRHLQVKHGITNVRIGTEKMGPPGGTTCLKYRFKEFKDVDDFLAKNTIERNVSSIMAMKKEEEREGEVEGEVEGEEVVEQIEQIEHIEQVIEQEVGEMTVVTQIEGAVEAHDSETQEASEILAGIGAHAEVATVQIATEHLYEIDGEQVAVLYI